MKRLTLYTPTASFNLYKQGAGSGRNYVEFIAEDFVVSPRAVEFVGGPLAGAKLYYGASPFLITEDRS